MPATKAVGATLVSTQTTIAGTVAAQGAAFNMASATLVSYGVDIRWLHTVVKDADACATAFLDADPTPFVIKSCRGA